jgi:hypothetical protein
MVAFDHLRETPRSRRRPNRCRQRAEGDGASHAVGERGERLFASGSATGSSAGGDRTRIADQLRSDLVARRLPVARAQAGGGAPPRRRREPLIRA